MEVVAYYQYLKGKGGSTSLEKEEMCLRVGKCKAQCTKNSAVLKEAMATMFEADEFCSQDPHLEGAQVFGLLKCKPNLPLGFEHESHRLSKVNFSQPSDLEGLLRHAWLL